MSPSGVFTRLMSTEEAQVALGIKLHEHLIRLSLAHYQKHYPVASGTPFYSLVLGDGEPFFDGAFVKHLAACQDCFPALVAARYEKPSIHEASLLISEDELDQLR